ncbi:hypothetical protein ACK3TF_005011 [Chlorella vulgaris]
MWHQTVSLRPAWFGQTRRPSAVPRPALRPAGYARINRRSWPARQQEQQRLAVTGASVSLSNDSGTAAQRLLQLSQRHDTQAAGDSHFHQQLTVEERLARIEMLLQQGVTEETVQRIITSNKGGPYMKSASQGAAILAVLRERGCSDADMNHVLQFQPSVLGRTAGSIGDVFAALDDMLQLSRPKILRVCLRQPSLLTHYSDTLRQRWSWVQAHYGLSRAAVASLAKRMVSSRAVGNLLVSNQDTIMNRWSGMQRLFELSDAEFDPDDKRRFITSRGALQLPEPTIRNVFSGVEQLMGSTAAAQSLLLRAPKSFVSGIKRLATNLGALQQLYGCSLQQAQQVLMRTPQIAYLMLEAPKFQSRVAALTEWYGHASPASMLLARSRGSQLMASMWKLGARMAFIHRLRLERAEPELNTTMLASAAKEFCQSVRVSEEELNRRSWPARQQEQQRLAVTGASVSLSNDSGSAAQRLLQLSQQHDTVTVGDREFYKQLKADERLARIQMLLQQGVTEETVQRIITRLKGGPYMQSVSEGAAILAVLRNRGCSDADINLLLRLRPDVITRPASSVGDVFAALDDMLQLSRPKILRVCFRQPSLLASRGDKLRQRWAWVLAHYKLSEAAVASLARRMVNSRNVCNLLGFSQDTITARLSGLQRVFELSDAEVSKLFPYLAELLEADPERHIRPRWDLYQSLLGELDPADKRRFIINPETLQLPEPTIRDVFSRVEQLMGSTAAAQDLLQRSPKSFGTAMLLVPARGSQLMSSMWKLGARMAFIRRLRLERAEPELNTKQLAFTTERFCQAVRVSEEVYAAFEQRWLASPEAAELCRHEDPPHVKVIGAAEAET